MDFLQGEDFKSFYRFAFLFSLEGTRRNIGPSYPPTHPPPHRVQHLIPTAVFSSTHPPTHPLLHAEKDMIVELLPMVIGQRSEYTQSFIAFLNETKKPEVSSPTHPPTYPPIDGWRRRRRFERAAEVYGVVGGWVGGWMGFTAPLIRTARFSSTQPTPPPTHLLLSQEMITADQWNQYLDMSQAYPTQDLLLKNFEQDSAWPLLLGTSTHPPTHPPITSNSAF